MLNTQKLCLLLALSLTVCTVATSQDQSPVAIMTMMDAEDVGMYMDVELDIWKPVHAQRIRDGEIIGWYLYAVALDNGEDYNYATVEVYPNWNSLETMYSTIDKVFEEVHGADQDSLDWMSDQTQKSRDIVRSYRWSRAMGVFGDNVGDSKYYTIDWMDIKPGHGGQYYRMEGDYYKPVHQKRVDAGKITSWALYSNMSYSELPGSIDAVTVAGYVNWADIWNSYPENAWEDAHPGMDRDAIGERMMEHRVMTGTSVYRLVDYVDAESIDD